MGAYYDALCEAMNLLAEHPRSIFLGQSVGSPGTGMTASFAKVPKEKLLEMPVAEELQMGMSIGLSLDGMLPVCVFPRINFMLCAMDQLVLHLDAIPRYSEYRPKVIIRTAIATPIPLDPGPQHTGDFCEVFREMLSTVIVVTLHRADGIVAAYRDAIASPRSFLIVEYPELYND